ncbi:MAG TPA: hypothetical protein VHA70_06710 [Bauldia sp.]|nr:hypothetical protein [Bauldia sp.]
MSHDNALWAMTEDGAVIMAALGDGVPPTVDVFPNNDARLRWQAAAIGWPLAQPAAGHPSAFAVVFPLPARERSALRSVSLALPGRKIALALGKPASLDIVFRTIAAESGAGFAAVVDGLVEGLLGESPSPARIRAAATLIRLAARHTGFIEVCGISEGEEMFLQGWASDLPAGRTRILTVGEPPAIAELAAASYDRDDLGSRGHGFAGIVAPAPLGDPSLLTQILYRGEEGWRAIEVYNQRKLIAAREIPGHLRSLMPRATAPEDVLIRLRRTAHRFDGRETVSQLQEPVRLGIDLAVALPGSGILVAGWLLDPRNRVRAVRLHTGAESVVISNDWTRLPRADVAGAYAGDPLFRELTASAKQSGFLAFAGIAGVNPGPAHLELDLGGGNPPSFFPLTFAEAPPREVIGKLLSSIDPRTAAADAIVERQLGPMLRAAGHVPPSTAETTDLGPPAAFDDPASVALVIGADERAGDALGLLPLLAIDPYARRLPVVFAAPAEALSAITGDIRRLASFYRLSLRLVPTMPAADAFDGLEAGVAATRAGTLALLAANLLPASPGWLQRLLETYRQNGGRHLVSPTVLFEDNSVRWAGTEFGERNGKREIRFRHRGFPRAALAGAELLEVSAGTLECCVVSRAGFEAAGGFARAYLGPAAKNLDMALRIRLAGTPALWQPETEMVAAEERPAAAEPPLAGRVDQWAFDHRWALALTNMRR